MRNERVILSRQQRKGICQQQIRNWLGFDRKVAELSDVPQREKFVVIADVKWNSRGLDLKIGVRSELPDLFFHEAIEMVERKAVIRENVNFCYRHF